MKLKTLINNNKKEFDREFSLLLKDNLDNSILSKAMRYGTINGGKRIRPFLVSEAAKLVNLSKKNSLIIASAIELIHSYSLIHDDLPCMDDDDFRRGKLSTHKKFGEATAVLAGDALHDLAFELISGNIKTKDYKSNLNLINYLSKCIGNKGLASGQSLDLLYENKTIKKINVLKMYKMKTGKLFEFSFCAPFILTNKSKKEIKFAKEFGILFGLIFQIVDDLIDQQGSFKELGKTPGKDHKQGKSTLIKMIGYNNVKKYCNEEVIKFAKKHNNYLKRNKTVEDLLYFLIKKID